MAATNSSTASTSKFSNAIPLQTMHNLIKRVGGEDYRWSAEAIQLIRSVSEEHVADTFTRARAFAEHGKRKGVDLTDMRLARQYTGEPETTQVSLETSI